MCNQGLTSVTPKMDRRNGRIFLLSYALFYLASPVLNVGVVQAALCDRLGASALMANMPAAAYGFGNVLPVILFPIIPYRWERGVVVIANCFTTVGLLAVCITLFFSFSNAVRLAAVVGQGMVTGLTASIFAVYVFQCLGRGTTVEGRSRTLKLTFSLGPICAVFASLGTQLVLEHGLRQQTYAHAFALIFLFATPCSATMALLSSMYELVWIDDKERPHFFSFFSSAVKSFASDGRLIILWFVYFLWTFSYLTEPNISLHVRQVLGQAPQGFSGLLLAIRFGTKAMAGFVIGAIAVRRGIRSPVITTMLLTGAAILWAYLVPGNFYLLAFGFAGAGELADVYLNNYAVTVSSKETGASNLALLHLAVPMAGIAPVVYGALADSFGFKFSIIFGLVPLLVSLWLVSRLPSRLGHGLIS